MQNKNKLKLLGINYKKALWHAGIGGKSFIIEGVFIKKEKKKNNAENTKTNKKNWQ